MQDERLPIIIALTSGENKPEKYINYNFMKHIIQDTFCSN